MTHVMAPELAGDQSHAVPVRAELWCLRKQFVGI